MLSLLYLFAAGLGISFGGTLPPGSLNMCALQIAVRENPRGAWRFALGVTLVEVLYVRVSLHAGQWVTAHAALFRAMEWMTTGLFVVLAVIQFLPARGGAGEEKNWLPGRRMGRFWLGASMSALNPVQIPFWFIWSSWLMSIQVLPASAGAYTLYTLGIGLGTLGGLGVFIWGGRRAVSRLRTGRRSMNRITGAVLLLSAIGQCIHLLQ